VQSSAQKEAKPAEADFEVIQPFNAEFSFRGLVVCAG
jgi:hypothetical protein